ncbi:MAG: zinc dependent phospholipase C family protein [Mobilitalea sp.]
MYFYTHLYMAKVLYQHFNEEIKLDPHSFSYGNIKPDLPSRTRAHHTLDNCLATVCEKANQLLEKEMTVKTFSVILGEICHYVCDFCCYPHYNEELHNQNFKHFTYELKLHKKLLHKKYILNPSRKLPQKDINSIVLEMRYHYSSAPQSMQRDIDFAFASAVWVCESIIYFIKNSLETENELDRTLYQFLVEEGGIL